MTPRPPQPEPANRDAPRDDLRPRVGIVGAGDRGTVYADALAAAPHPVRIAAVVEPSEARRSQLAVRHALGPERAFATWDGLLRARPDLDAVVVATPDRLHAPVAEAALAEGWHVLLEKPFATDAAEALRLVRTAERSGRTVVVCHVLRYTRFFRAVRRVVRSGALGRITAVSWRENVHRLHFAHSYVRGNWRRRDTSGPLILTKCSHDLDLLTWLFGVDVARVASTGGRRSFHRDAAPAGAAERCDVCSLAATCPYDAGRFYVDDPWGWSTKALGPDLDTGARRDALATSPYGRCVWRCDNDVVDRQSALLEATDGTALTLTVVGTASEEGRTFRVDGSAASLVGAFRGREPWLELRRPSSAQHGGAFPSAAVEPIDVGAASDASGHGGGDAALAHAFARFLATGDLAPGAPTIRASLESHLLAFAADAARREGRWVSLEPFRRGAAGGSGTGTPGDR